MKMQTKAFTCGLTSAEVLKPLTVIATTKLKWMRIETSTKAKLQAADWLGCLLIDRLEWSVALIDLESGVSCCNSPVCFHFLQSRRDREKAEELDYVTQRSVVISVKWMLITIFCVIIHNDQACSSFSYSWFVSAYQEQLFLGFTDTRDLNLQQKSEFCWFVSHRVQRIKTLICLALLVSDFQRTVKKITFMG